MFASAPRTVSPDACAAVPAAPRLFSIAAWNVSKSTLPADAMADASSAVTPRCSASICKIGNPRSCSWFTESICSLLDAATLLKIDPSSPIDPPVIVAVSPTSLSVRCRSCPGFTPDATADAATAAASPMPNAVPFTAASASSMICDTPSAVCPSPVSFACASSMFSARSRPAPSVFFTTPIAAESAELIAPPRTAPIAPPIAAERATPP